MHEIWVKKDGILGFHLNKFLYSADGKGINRINISTGSDKNF